MAIRQYIGARYVPKFATPIEWNSALSYEALTIVTHLGNSFTSKKPVPAGIDITNTEYWVNTGNYNAQVEQYRQDTIAVKTDVNTIKQTVSKIVYNNVKLFGAVGDGKSHKLSEFFNALSEAKIIYPFVNDLDCEIDYAAIQKAVNECDYIYIPTGKYIIDQTIIVPNSKSKNLVIVGEGFKNTIFSFTSDKCFKYIRNATAGTGCSLIVSDCCFVGNNNNTAIYFHGVIEGAARYEDNWLRVNRCSFYALNRAIDLYCCGNIYIEGCYAQGVNVMCHLGRAASFFTMQNQMCLECGSMVYADDATPDGVSNGITLINCNAVLSTDAEIRINGWEEVKIIRCSADLGSGENSTHIFLYNVSTFTVSDCWVSGQIGKANTIGIRAWNCHSGVICNNGIYNNEFGIRIDGKTLNIPNGIKVNNNTFAGNTKNDVAVIGSVGIIISNNIFRTEIALSGTGQPVYVNTEGTDYITLNCNMFANSDWSIVMPAHNYNAGNIYGLTT